MEISRSEQFRYVTWELLGKKDYTTGSSSFCITLKFYILCLFVILVKQLDKNN